MNPARTADAETAHRTADVRRSSKDRTEPAADAIIAATAKYMNTSQPIIFSDLK
jgi:hypothetical protein